MKSLYMLFTIPIVFLSCSSNQDVVIPDTNLAAAVREALDLDPTDPIPRKQLEQLGTTQCWRKRHKKPDRIGKSNRFESLKTLQE